MLATFLWGFSEATFFFLIPDVILTAIALKGFKIGFYASVIALVGALLGGSLMYFMGAFHYELIYDLVVRIPAVSEEMLHKVERQLQEQGLFAMIIGPIGGIPYKTFAITAPSAGIGFWAFLLASVPARFIRFFLTSAIASFVANVWLKHCSIRSSYMIWFVVWVIVYCIYFSIHL